MKIAISFFITIFLGCGFPTINKEWAGDYLLQKGMGYNGSKWINSAQKEPLYLQLDSKSGLLYFNDTTIYRNRITFLIDKNPLYLTFPDTLPLRGSRRVWIRYFEKKIPYTMKIYYNTPNSEREIRIKASAENKDKLDELTLYDFTIVLKKKENKR